MSQTNTSTFFTNDSSGAANSVDYIQDAFPDISDTPSSQVGFSSTTSNNPLNGLYGNDDFPRYGPKTLWVKDIVLLQDRSLWIQGKPTYQIIWNEPFPSAQGYVFGDVTLVKNSDQTYVSIKQDLDGCGVSGVFARCMFLMLGNTSSSGNTSGNVFLDGSSNGVTVNWGSLASANPAFNSMYAATVHNTSNETYNIHDFRLVAAYPGNGVQAIFNFQGVVVYSENSSLTIDQFPGITYNNKTQSKTVNGVTIPLPSFGNSLGGKITLWKNSNAGYSMSIISPGYLQSIAQGSSGTNILNLTAGTGQSFSSSWGVITAGSGGASNYVGIIQSISTDALTVYPTLPFGISFNIYPYFKSGPSLTPNPSLTVLSFTFGSTEILRQGYSGTYLDPLQRFAVWSPVNVGQTLTNTKWALGFSGSFLQVEGYFTDAKLEWYGITIAYLNGTMCVNGLPAFNFGAVGVTGFYTSSVLTNAAPGWNSFCFYPGPTMQNMVLNRIHLYQRNNDMSASFGLLATMDTLQAFTNYTHNATTICPGLFKRTFSDQLQLNGPWSRLVSSIYAGGVAYAGSTTTCTASFNYYGNHFSVIGSNGSGSSANISLDSGSNLGSTAINQVQLASSLTFHSVSLAILGGTFLISAIDFFRINGEMKNLQTFAYPGLGASYQSAIPQDVCARWYGAQGGLTYSTGATNLLLTTMDYDRWGIYNSSSGMIKVPLPGKYQVNVNLGVNVVAGGVLHVLRIQRNGVNSDVNFMLTPTNLQANNRISAIYNLNAGDLISFTTNLSGNSGTIPDATVTYANMSIARLPYG